MKTWKAKYNTTGFIQVVNAFMPSLGAKKTNNQNTARSQQSTLSHSSFVPLVNVKKRFDKRFLTQFEYLMHYDEASHVLVEKCPGLDLWT